MMRYRIEHLACACDDRAPVDVATPRDVALYLWGRGVLSHVVWAGECPYQFGIADIALIEALLTDCPVPMVRPYLPCVFWAGTQPLVTIGWPDAHDHQHFQDISYMEWLKTQSTGTLV